MWSHCILPQHTKIVASFPGFASQHFLHFNTRAKNAGLWSLGMRLQKLLVPCWWTLTLISDHLLLEAMTQGRDDALFV